MVRTLYKRLLLLYPRRFRERLGESMEQTFNDLWNEQKRQPAHGFFMLSIFTETTIGIVRENLLVLFEENIMKNMLANATAAAITSFILALPMGLTYVILMFDIQPLANAFNDLFTIPGQQGDINILGRIVIYGGCLLLLVAFILNIRPLLRKEGTGGKREPYTLNLIVGVAILLLITFTWGALILEEIYCLRGIRCD